MPGHVHHARDDSYIFVGSKRGAPLSNTAMLELMRTLRPDYVPRGFRSTFGDWAAECTKVPREAPRRRFVYR